MGGWAKHKNDLSRVTTAVGSDASNDYFTLTVVRAKQGEETAIINALESDYSPGCNWEKQFGFPKKTYKIVKWLHRDGKEKLCWALPKVIDKRNVFEKSELSSRPLSTNDIHEFSGLDLSSWEYAFAEVTSGMQFARVSGDLERDLINFIDDGGDSKKEIRSKPHELVVVNDNQMKRRVLWRFPKDSGDLIEDTNPRIKTKNPDRHWLTYETLFNWAPFCKTNQKFEAAAYRVPAERMSVLLAPPEDLDDETLTTLCKVFFPTVKTPGGDIDLSRMRKIGRLPWETRSLEFEPPVADGIHASGGLGAAKQEHYIVMPYNLRDNKSSSAAIGTRASSRQQEIPLRDFGNTLPMWNSSSRSSVMDFTGVETKNWIASPSDSNDGEAFLWPEDKFGETKALRFMEPDQAGDEQFKIPNDPNYHQKIFSVKTGVNLIGFAVQESKAKLEHNSILAALRSAFVGDTERRFKFDSYNDPHLLILKEILTVTERDPEQKLWFDLKTDRDYWSHKNPDTIGRLREIVRQPKFGDGLQVRSLRGMKHDCEYFPPTSIPFVGVMGDRIDENSECIISHDAVGKVAGESEQNWIKNGMPRVLSAFKHIDDETWCNFWEQHYAKPLGRTKAMLLLRYALQGFGGNAQNYLLETKGGKPTGRIILRDMGDYALHDFVLWAMFGPKNDLPPDSRKRGVGEHSPDVENWKKAFQNHPLLHFECDVLHQFNHDYNSPSDPGGISEFPTFTGYHRANVTGMHTFNPFCNCCADGPFVGHISPLWAYAMPVGPNAIKRFHSDISASQWAKVLEVQARWGIAHAKSWLRYLSRALKHDFEIDFDPVPISVLGDREKPERVHDPADYQRVTTTRSDGREIYSGGFGESSVTDMGSASHQFEEIMLKMSDIYKAFKNWEMYLGKQVEDFLITREGQKAIRDYLNNWRSFDG